MTKKLILIALLFTTPIIFSCHSKSKTAAKADGLVTPRQEKVLAVATLPDSSKTLEVMYRIIGVGINPDSAKNKYDVVIDTSWYLIRMVEKKGADGKVVTDSTGKPVGEEKYFARPKDSIAWNISGIPIDTLLSKRRPAKG